MSVVQLGPARKLVFPRSGHPRGPIVFQREGNELWRREGLLIPDSVRMLAQVKMEGWIDAEEADVLEQWFAGTALPRVPSHIALFITSPIDDGSGGVEATGGSYERDPLARNGTNWGSSAGGAPSTIQNLIVVTFVTASANWGTVTSWAYFDAVTVGNLLFFAVLDTAKAVNSGDTAEFAAGNMVGQLGDPGDSY